MTNLGMKTFRLVDEIYESRWLGKQGSALRRSSLGLVDDGRDQGGADAAGGVRLHQVPLETTPSDRPTDRKVRKAGNGAHLGDGGRRELVELEHQQLVVGGVVLDERAAHADLHLGLADHLHQRRHGCQSALHETRSAAHKKRETCGDDARRAQRDGVAHLAHDHVVGRAVHGDLQLLQDALRVAERRQRVGVAETKPGGTDGLFEERSKIILDAFSC